MKTSKQQNSQREVHTNQVLDLTNKSKAFHYVMNEDRGKLKKDKPTPDIKRINNLKLMTSQDTCKDPDKIV